MQRHLGLLLLLALLTAGCQTAPLSPQQRARQATQRIERLGGRIDQQDLGASVSLYQAEPGAVRRAMRAVGGLRPVDSLTLFPDEPTRLDLRTLGRLPALRTLLLRNVRLGEQDIAYLSNKLPNLKALRLINTGITDQQLAELTPALRRVHALTLVGEPITNRSLDTLRRLDNLRRLRLINTRVDPDAAKELTDINPYLIVEIDGQRFRGYEATE